MTCHLIGSEVFFPMVCKVMIYLTVDGALDLTGVLSSVYRYKETAH